MKRLLLALLFATLAYALALASAATLTVQPSSLGAGNGAATACDTDVTTTYQTTYTQPNGYVVSNVVVGNLDTAACAGKTIGVTLTDGSGNSVGSGTLAVPASGTSATVPMTANTPAASVLKAFVIIG
jgi:hypothetical protein